MSDIADIPPAPAPVSPSAPAAQQQQIPAAEPQPAPQTIAAAPVEQAPPALQNPPEPVRIEGRVAASDPATGQTRIQTAQGDVVVQLPASLPPGTDVSVQLYMDMARELANITVLKRQAAMAQEIEQVAAPSKPPPPLQPGTTVTAILLEEPPAPATQPLPAAAQTLSNTAQPISNAAQPLSDAAQPLPLEKTAQIITQLKNAGAVDFPPSLPTPPAGLQKIFAAPNAFQALRSLPIAVQEKITAFVSSPAFLNFVKNALPEQQWKSLNVALPALQTPEPPGIIRRLLSAYLPRLGEKIPDLPPAPVSENAGDDNLLSVAPLPRPQALRPAAPQIILQPVAPFSTGALLPLIEHLAEETKTAPLLRQLIAAVSPQDSAPLPKNMYELKIIAVRPPGSSATPLPPGTQEAEVESLTPGGNPVIRTEDGRHFVLRAPADIAVGSKIVITEKQMTPEQILASLKPPVKTDEPGFDPLTADTWPALRQAVAAAPPAIAQAMQNSVPSPTPHMAPAALLFLAALRMGAIENWLGENLPALRQAGKSALADRLAGDFGKISEQSKEALPGGWKMISMPLFHDEQFSQMQFLVRRDARDGNQGEDGGKPATRFLLNLNLSRMGGMQLDGFIHKKQFDLVLRTQDALPFTMRQEIAKRFAAGLEQVRLQGGMSFQAQRQGWVAVETPGNSGTMA